MSNRNRKYQHAIKLVQQCGPEVILRAADVCDGHTIFKPEAFTQAGLPLEVVELHTRNYNSDGSHKGTIFVEGEPVEKLLGVYGLDLLKFVASALRIDYPSALGRGSQARKIQMALRQHFAGKPDPARPTPA